ncbi:transcription repressor OFP16-like [Vigna unguiculata]|uniref:Transcription repressor n=1 Tax=Vigna unguiculata TaxID=3917 RepID=A0A4D6N355_VIGUN|nr:transcription repressor OFP16-like [Vigna unguiculata]QCE06457.1 Ovate protein family [Vigna unguiculata]
MPNTRNLRHLNLNMCCSNSATPDSETPPLSPITTSSHHNIHSASPSSIMIKNFNSIYDPTLTSNNSFTSTFFSTTTFFEPEPEPQPADFATACASQRFFFSSPGHSNSLLQYTNKATQHHSPSLREDGADVEKTKMNKKVPFKGSVAVATYSPDPYVDFRRSMQEMVEARPELMDVKSNWNVLHELLLCYLALNPKNTHKFILGAFADLLVSLMSF